jgi:AraC-like DNA-binding protein
MMQFLPLYDGIEILRFQEHRKGFPRHVHDTFCVSLVTQGTEAIATEDRMLHGQGGSITLTNPHEVHANPVVGDEDAAAPATVSFTTLYLHQDFVDWMSGRRHVRYTEQCWRNEELVRRFRSLANAISAGKEYDIQTTGRAFFTALSSLHGTIGHVGAGQLSPPESQWADLLAFIETNLAETITLDQLARVMHRSRYHFAKLFRTKFGLPPMQYVLMRKVFAARAQVRSPSETISEVAYRYGFSDPAHFSRTFSRYVGLSPSQYRHQCANSGGD